MARSNPHAGSTFDEFLKEEGIYDEVQARALKRAITEHLEEDAGREADETGMDRKWRPAALSSTSSGSKSDRNFTCGPRFVADCD
jgi:hypothetical protein